MMYIMIGFGGIVGSLMRYIIGVIVPTPYGTLFVNLIGCFLMGWLTIYFARIFLESPIVANCITTGFLGSFTTFSTFSVDVVEIVKDGSPVFSLFYVFSSIAGGVLFTYAGYWIGSKRFRKLKEQVM